MYFNLNAMFELHFMFFSKSQMVKMYTKIVVTRQFLIVKVVSFKISNPDSIEVKFK